MRDWREIPHTAARLAFREWLLEAVALRVRVGDAVRLRVRVGDAVQLRVGLLVGEGREGVLVFV